MKRIFIGIKINPDRNFGQLISSLKKELSYDNIKWTDQANMHVTLVFLGGTAEDKLKSIGAMLKERCEGSGSFEVSLKGLGVFKNFRDPKVLWAGFYQSDKLNSLQSSVVSGLMDIGINIENRPFSPHLTIGRIKHIGDKDNLKVLLLKYHSTDIQTVPVEEVILYESILKKEGPVYTPLSVFKL